MPSLFAVCVGRNFKFGKERTGDSQLLAKKGGNSGIKIEIIDSKIMDGQAISSSRIRIALSSGKIDQVNEMLGRNYMIGGLVKIGKGIGRKFGFPTLNLDWDPESRPAYGVYSGFLSDESGHPRFPAVANYGLRPTVESGDSIPKLEIHALNDLNSEEWKPEKWVNMELCKFIRVEKFESIDQLREQISEDKQTAIQWFQENDQKLNLKGWTPTSGSSSNFSLLSMVPVFDKSLHLSIEHGKAILWEDRLHAYQLNPWPRLLQIIFFQKVFEFVVWTIFHFVDLDIILSAKEPRLPSNSPFPENIFDLREGL